jgi:signal transduction histidine kinase
MSAIPGWQPTIVAPLPGESELPGVSASLADDRSGSVRHEAVGLGWLLTGAGLFLVGVLAWPTLSSASTSSFALVWLAGVVAGVAWLWRWQVSRVRRARERRRQAERLRVAEAALQATRARLVQHDQAVNRRVEASRLLRELHDSVGARLVSALSLAQQVPLQPGSLVPDGAGEQLLELRRQVEASLLELRLSLDHLGRSEDVPLLRALADLRDHVEPLLAAAGTRLTWHCGTGVEAVALGSLTTLQLTRIAQEALLNVARQAAPTAEARVLLELIEGETGRHLRLAIGDAGPAGDASTADADGPQSRQRSGLAWARLQRQAGELGAQLITGAGTDGWLVDLVLPLPHGE